MLSTALRISILFASRATTKVYVFWLSARSVDRSVTTGRITMLLGSRMSHLRGTLERRRLDDQRVGPQHVVRRLLTERDHLHAGNVPRREVDHRLVPIRQDQHVARGAGLLQQLDDPLRLRRLEIEPLDQDHRLVLRPRVVGRAARQPANLLRHVLVIVPPRPRAEHDTAPAPVRRTGRTLPGPAGPLLAPGLLVATRALAPPARRSRALTLIRQVGLHRLPHRRLMHDAVEEDLGQLPPRLLLSVDREDRCLEHRHPPWRASPARFTITPC